MVRKGYEGKNVERLVESIKNAYRQIRGTDPPPVLTAEVSMWWDVYIFNEVGIPLVTFGPRRFHLSETEDRPASPDAGYMEKDDLIKTAKMYALVALNICRSKKSI